MRETSSRLPPGHVIVTLEPWRSTIPPWGKRTERSGRVSGLPPIVSGTVPLA